METKLKINDRVDVYQKGTQNWVKNAIVWDITDNMYRVGRDENTTHSHMGLMFCIGKLSCTSFDIKKSI